MTGTLVAAAVVAVLVVALWCLSRSVYGRARISELPGLLWCLLAGRQYRHQARAILRRREDPRDYLENARTEMRALGAELKALRAAEGAAAETAHLAGEIATALKAQSPGRPPHLRPSVYAGRQEHGCRPCWEAGRVHNWDQD